jgi:hypothetical protein
MNSLTFTSLMASQGLNHQTIVFFRAVRILHVFNHYGILLALLVHNTIDDSNYWVFHFADVPEGSFIVRAHTPMSNLFSCLWFNEVDRFTSRDQLSFAYTYLKLRRMNPDTPFKLHMFKVNHTSLSLCAQCVLLLCM